MRLMSSNENIRQFYEDAIYCHLISIGYTRERARTVANIKAKKMQIFIEQKG